MEELQGKKRSDIILERFQKARRKRQHMETIWHELDAYDRNEQWELDGKLPPWIPKPVTNFVHLVKYTKRAALAMENPTGKLRPTHPATVQSVEMLDKAFQFTFEKIKARKVVRQNIETAKLLGTAIAQVYWDEQAEGRMGTTVLGSPQGALYEGEIKVKEIDPSCFYPSPNAFSIDDCEYIHIVERKPLEWIKKHPLFKEKAANLKSQPDVPEERGEIYNRDYGVESDGLIDFHQHFEKIPNAEGGFNYAVTYLAGKTELHHIERLEPNRYPFAILYDFPQRQDFWAMSTCQFVLDNQKIINKIESILAMIATQMQNPQKVVDKSSGIDPKEVATFGNASGHVFVSNGDPSRAMTWQQPPQIPVALINLLANAKENIREITGLTEAYMGQTVGSLQTSSGVDSLIERATMRDRDQMYDIELYIEQLSSLVIDFMVTKYTEERMIRITRANPEDYEFVSFVGSDYKDIEYDFFIDVSSKAPVTRLREAQEAKDLMNMQGQFAFEVPVITPQEYMKISNFTHADQLIQRMNRDEMNNEVQKLDQVFNMVLEASQEGVPPQEVQQMMHAMWQQMEQGGGAMGNVANANEFQARQAGSI
jgi:hypothetical protein